MALVLVIRDFPEELQLEDILKGSLESRGCLTSWNVDWVQSFRNPATNRMLCFFSAPDAESVRMAMRQNGWTRSAIVKAVQHTKARADIAGNVVVERHFEAPVKLEAVQSLEDEHA